MCSESVQRDVLSTSQGLLDYMLRAMFHVPLIHRRQNIARVPSLDETEYLARTCLFPLLTGCICVAIALSRGVLVVSWGVPGLCLTFLWGVWVVSGLCITFRWDVWVVSGLCISFRWGVWVVSWLCLGCAWVVPGLCLGLCCV